MYLAQVFQVSIDAAIAARPYGLSAQATLSAHPGETHTDHARSYPQVGSSSQSAPVFPLSNYPANSHFFDQKLIIRFGFRPNVVYWCDPVIKAAQPSIRGCNRVLY